MKISTARKQFNSQIKELYEKKEKFCKSPGKDFTRKRKQNFESIIRTVLSLDGGTLTNEILRINRYSANAPSPSAFIQQRSKLSDTAFPSLFSALNKTFDKDTRWNGYRMIAVDGSHIHVPNNPNDLDSYVCCKENEHFHNEFHLNTLWDIMQGTFIDAVIQKYRTQNEDRALIEMTEHTKLAKAIVICDRGYEAYNNIAHLEEAGWKYIIRIKEKGNYGISDGLDLPDEEEYDFSTQLSFTRKRSREIMELVKDRNKYKYLPSNSTFDYLPPSKRNEPAIFYTLNFRIVKFKISENRHEMLLTNLSKDEFTPEKLKKIYAMRWGIETSFRNLKYIIGMLKFHSKKSEFISQEIYANLIMHNMTVVIAACVTMPDRKRKYEYKIRFSTAANIVKHLLSGDASPPVAEKLILRNITPVRPNRQYPRKKVQLRTLFQFVYRIS